MKKLLTLVFVMTSSVQAFTGHDGNGGNLVICQQLNGADTYELLDYYEGRNNTAKDVILPDGDNYLDIAKKIIDAPYINRTQVKSKDLKKDLFELIDHFDDDMVLTEDDLVDIPDHGEVRIASNCNIKQLVVQYANPEENTRQYLIDNKIWRYLSNKEKASVVVHEVIYNQAISLGHNDSRQVRAAHFALAARLRDVNFEEALLERTDLIRNCSENISDKYYNWGATFCTQIYLNTIADGVFNYIQRLKWLRKFDMVWDINQPIRFTKGLLESLKSTISEVVNYNDETLLDILFSDESNFNKRLYTFFGQTDDIELKTKIIEIFSYLPSDKIRDDFALSVASIADQVYYNYLNTRGGSSYKPFYCKFSEEIFCNKSISEYKEVFKNPFFTFLSSKAKTLPVVKDAFLNIVRKLDLNKYSEERIELAYIIKIAIETDILDTEFALIALDRIKNVSESGWTYLYTPSVWVNINKNVQDVQVKEKLIEVYFQYFTNYTFFLKNEIFEYVWSENNSDFNIGGVDLVFNTALMPMISNKIIEGSGFLGELFLSFYLRNINVVETSSVSQQALTLIVREILEQKGSTIKPSISSLEYGLDKIDALTILPDYIAKEFINSFFTNTYKQKKYSKIVVKMLDLILKTESLAQNLKFQIRTLGETDPREEVRVKAIEVYDQIQ